MANFTMTGMQYAAHRGVSSAMISKYKKRGYLKGAMNSKGKIDPDLADELLAGCLNGYRTQKNGARNGSNT